MKISLDVLLAAGKGILTGVEKHISESDDAQKMIFGSYTNGKPRSLADAISGEIIHPEDKLLITQRLEEHKKLKEAKEKRGKKYAKIDLDELDSVFYDDDEDDDDEYDEWDDDDDDEDDDDGYNVNVTFF